MGYFKEISLEDRKKYLEENDFQDESPKLTDKKLCIHCNQIITIGDFKVYVDDEGNEFIFCPNAPECNGTLINWFPPDFSFD